MKENYMEDEIQMEPVVSSNVAAIGFNAKTGIMRIKFLNGGLYETVGASQADYDAFKLAKSKGSYFAKVLKTSKSFSWGKVEKKG
jgi:hypothetical protein